MMFNKDNPHEQYAEKMSATAIEYGQSFDKYLNYSKESIRDLDAILEYYHTDMKVNQPTEGQLWAMSTIFGSYLGETMLKNGLADNLYNWDMHEDFNHLMLIDENESFINPIDKVYKRLLNGMEDSVISFYDVVMEMEQ